MALLSCWSVGNLNKNVKAIPFVLKATLTVLRLLLLINLHSGQERTNSYVITKLRGEKKAHFNWALVGHNNPQVPTSSRAVKTSGEPSHFNYHH